MSNNIIEIADNELGHTFRLKIARDNQGDFIATQEGAPPDVPPNRLMAQTWSQARREARVILYAIRACMRSSQGFPYGLPEDLTSLADEVIPAMTKGKIRIGKDEEDIPALLQRLLAGMQIEFHERIPETAFKEISDALRSELPETVIELSGEA